MLSESTAKCYYIMLINNQLTMLDHLNDPISALIIIILSLMVITFRVIMHSLIDLC